MSLFKIIFQDNSEFIGGNSLYQSKWDSIPKDKGISSLLYYLPDGNALQLTGYEAYAHVVEATMNLYRKFGVRGKTVIRNVYIMGLKNGIVTSYRITLYESDKNSKYKIGDILRREYKKGIEFRGQKVADHKWKDGVK